MQRVNEGVKSFPGEESDELLRRLREWAASRERHHQEAEARKLATTCVDLDSKLLGTLILKLVQVEKSLKELRHTRKVANAARGLGAQRRKGMVAHRASAISSSNTYSRK